ncbi:MAG TPA: EAL domain-containing protein [Spongiibacteraceae bacterium]
MTTKQLHEKNLEAGSIPNLAALSAANFTLPSELLRAILSTCGVGAFFYPVALDDEGTLIFSADNLELNWSLNMGALLGMADTPVDPEDFFARVHASDLALVRERFQHAITSGLGGDDSEYRIVRPDGQLRWLLSRYLIGRDENQQPVYIAGVCFDITARKQSEDTLAQAHAQLQQAQSHLSAALISSGIAIFRHHFATHDELLEIMNYDADTWNFNLADMYGYAADVVVTPEMMLTRIHPDDVAAVHEKSLKAIMEGLSEYQVEYRIRLDDGSQRWLLLKSMLERNREGELQFLTGAVIDISDRKAAEDRIQYLATHDGLTGLPNRVMFSNLLNYTIDTAKRYAHRFAVLFIDLDRFKAINDALGHQAGDLLLQEIARRLRACSRVSDVVARLSGDEFVMLVQEVDDKQQASAVARKVIAEVMKPIILRAQECRVTASIGICLYPDDGIDEQVLIKNADVAMYQAKEEGKNNFHFYDSNIQSYSLERMSLENQLRAALENGELSLQYQAKLDLQTDCINGVEALLRWNNPLLGAISPAQFIPIAEETGLIVPIGRWVLNTACAQNVAWQAQGLPPVCMAVNLSPRQFLNENLLNHIAEALRESGMAPALLELEITEGMVMHNVDQAVQLLHSIKRLGVRIAIDDFGTGYSSLAQLKRFPIDTLKVDRSFIREVAQDADDQAITEAIIAMGKSLSLTIVAEGVETQEQQDFLRKGACDEMQGYYFSRPVIAEEFAALLGQHIASPLM